MREKPARDLPEAVPYTAPIVEEPREQETPAENEAVTWRVIGEAMGTYILVEEPEGLLLIDKHAAHERILFESLRSRDTKIMSQVLLSPIVYSGGKRECAVLLSNISLLAEIGCEIEEFGIGAVLIRSVPSDADPEDAGVLLDSVSESIMAGKTGGFESMRDSLLHMMACKSAVKGGDITDKAELERLVEQVMTRSDLQYCPHGRPISMLLGKKVLDRHFKRI
jgi:DNA mismatch repair protein MutL